MGLPPENQKFRKRAFLGGGGTYPAPTPWLSFGRGDRGQLGCAARAGLGLLVPSPGGFILSATVPLGSSGVFDPLVHFQIF